MTIFLNTNMHDTFNFSVFESESLAESLDKSVYVWVDTKTNNLIVVDSGSRADGNTHVHHTDYVKRKPAVFGLSADDVMWATDIRDEQLLQTVLDKGFVRGVIDPDQSAIGVEASSMRLAYRGLRYCINYFSFQPTSVYIDIDKDVSSNPSGNEHYALSGQRLEFYLKHGSVPRSTLMMVEKSGDYRYWKSCVDFTDDVDDLIGMCDTGREISYETFMKNVGVSEVSSVFSDYNWGSSRRQGITLKGDYHVRYFVGKIYGYRVFYIVHSAIEYIFVPRDFVSPET